MNIPSQEKCFTMHPTFQGMEGVGERQRITITALNLILFPALSLPNIHTQSVLFLLLKFRRVYSTCPECFWKHEIKQNLYMWAFRIKVSLNFVSFSQLSEEIVQITDHLPCVYFIDSATSHSPFWPVVFKFEIFLLQMQDRADLQESPRMCPNSVKSQQNKWSHCSFSSFPPFPPGIFLPVGNGQEVYKQESLDCWLLATLSFKGRKVKTNKMDRIPLDQKSVRAIKLPSYVCVLLKMFIISDGHGKGTLLTKTAEQIESSQDFALSERDHWVDRWW